MPDIFVYGIEGCVRFVLYSIILWIMIKIQKLNYNWPGLLFVSAASIAISYVPVVGRYLTFPVLIAGLHQVTGAKIAPDILFTVGVTRAVMFCVQLFVIGALMVNLRPDLQASAREGDEEVEVADSEEQQEQQTPSAKEESGGYTLVGNNDPRAKGLALRGISINASKPLAIVSTGRSYYTVSTGECFVVETDKVRKTVRCDEITKSFVLLTINDSAQIKLRMQ
jgi:hypothetical protein